MSDKTHLVSSLPSMEQTNLQSEPNVCFQRKVAILKYSLKIFFTTCHYASSTFLLLKQEQ